MTATQRAVAGRSALRRGARDGGPVRAAASRPCAAHTAHRPPPPVYLDPVTRAAPVENNRAATGRPVAAAAAPRASRPSAMAAPKSDGSPGLTPLSDSRRCRVYGKQFCFQS